MHGDEKYQLELMLFMFLLPIRFVEIHWYVELLDFLGYLLVY